MYCAQQFDNQEAQLFTKVVLCVALHLTILPIVFQYGNRVGGPSRTFVYPKELRAVVRERFPKPLPQAAYDDQDRPHVSVPRYLTSRPTAAGCEEL